MLYARYIIYNEHDQAGVLSSSPYVNYDLGQKQNETEQQKNWLTILGCTEMQGFLFSPAIPAVEIRRLLLSVSGLPSLSVDGHTDKFTVR